jgi:exopolysaccharide biosynthesis protein
MKGGKSLVAPRRNDQKPSLAPRTAFGLSADGRWLYGVVVDGRQPGYSEGADMDDIVRILKAAGAVDAINMDGGGSSTFAWWNEGTQSVLIPNRHDAAYRNYRPVAMNLGFYFAD